MLHTLRQTQLDLQNPLIRHLTGTKNRVIYYSQANIGFNNDNINVTAPSPVNKTKYNRIDNMIIITTDEISQSFSIEDEGLANNEITAAGFMFPGTDPKSGDMFYMHELEDKGILYYITSVEPIVALDKTGWQIQFAKHYDQFEPHQLEHLVAAKYVFNFESVGTDTRIIYEHTTYRTYQYVQQLFTHTSNEFLRRFFDSSHNIILYHCNSPALYIDEYFTFPRGLYARDIVDPYIIEFFNTAFDSQKLIYRNYCVYPTIPIWIIEDTFKTAYKHSLFNALVKRNVKLMTHIYHYTRQFKAITIKDLAYDKWWFFDMLSLPNAGCITVHSDDFLSRIITNTLYDSTDNAATISFNMIINFINNPNYIPSIRDFELFEDIDLMDDDALYMIGPLLLYICKWYICLMGKKTY
jgi:hypothetical protein